jgi:hypothetical protein
MTDPSRRSVTRMTVPNVIDPKANHSTFFEARIERYGLGFNLSR